MCVLYTLTHSWYNHFWSINKLILLFNFQSFLISRIAVVSDCRLNIFYDVCPSFCLSTCLSVGLFAYLSVSLVFLNFAPMNSLYMFTNKKILFQFTKKSTGVSCPVQAGACIFFRPHPPSEAQRVRPPPQLDQGGGMGEGSGFLERLNALFTHKKYCCHAQRGWKKNQAVTGKYNKVEYFSVEQRYDSKYVIFFVHFCYLFIPLHVKWWFLCTWPHFPLFLLLLPKIFCTKKKKMKK